MKTLTKNKKYLKYALWLSPFLILMGLTAGVISGIWQPVPLALILAGVVVLVLWLIGQSNGEVTASASFWSRRSTQAGTNAIAATLAVLVILGLINFIAARNPLRVDLTETQLFTLAPLSQQVVRNFEQPVKVWIFDQNPNPQDTELLDNYRRQNSRFNFEYVSPDARPELAQRFGVKDAGEVYLEYGTKRQFVQSVNEYDRLSEIKLTNALEQIKSDRTAKIYFLQGHGELSLESGQEGLNQAVQVLQEKSFKSEPLTLADRPAVPPDASAVVVAGPKQSLFPGEVQALKDYLKRGGGLLLMINPKTNPGLDSLLQEWGVKLEDRLAINASDRQVRGYGAAAALVTQYGDHPITKDFGNNYSFYPFARPLDITPMSDVNMTPLLQTSDQSWAESNPDEKELKFDPQSDRQGPLILGVALSRRVDTIDTKDKKSDASNKPAEARLVVLGNANFASDSLFGQQLNGDVFLNSVKWLSQQETQSSLSIRPKQTKNRRIVLTPQQLRILSWTTLAIVPLLGFGGAGFLWWRRR